MLSYYTSIIALVWAALGVMCILVHENGRIEKGDKYLLYTTYFLIGISAFAEWCGVQLEGNTNYPSWMLKLAKCADYSLTPMAGGSLVMQMHLHNRWQKIMHGTLAANVVFQIVAAFNGWMVRIDDQNRSMNGPFYVAYLPVCMAIIILLVIQSVIYSRSFRRQNRKSLCAIICMVTASVLVQDITTAGYKMTFIGLTMGVALMFIHNSEFLQLAADEHLEKQQAIINTDVLTGVASRLAYIDALRRLESADILSDGFAAFTIDINGLKVVNDRLGHDAGDEMICGAARCIEKAFQEVGRCFRTGGDEFVVLARGIDEKRADGLLARLLQVTEAWRGEKVPRLSLATGYALAGECPSFSAEQLVREADLAMYESKADYYRITGHDRRRSR